MAPAHQAGRRSVCRGFHTPLRAIYHSSLEIWVIDCVYEAGRAFWSGRCELGTRGCSVCNMCVPSRGTRTLSTARAALKQHKNMRIYAPAYRLLWFRTAMSAGNMRRECWRTPLRASRSMRVAHQAQNE